MKFRNIYTAMLLCVVSSSSLMAASNLYSSSSDKKDSASNGKNTNRTQDLTVTKNDKEKNAELTDAKTGFEEEVIVDGNNDLGLADDPTTINYMAGNLTDEDIISVKKKKEKLAKVSNGNIEDVVLKSDTIYYNVEQGLESTVYLKYGYSTDIEFIDELGNPINVKGMSIGNKIFDAKTPEPNMISLLATAKYKETNFNVRLDGVKDPVILRIKEGSNNISNTRVKIVVTTSKLSEDETEMNMKTNILKELLKYGTLHGKTQLDYEVVDIARKETSYFEKKYLKIFRVEKGDKKFTIVLLDNMYEMLGQNKNSFNRYQNSFNVYFIPQNKEIFTIMTKLNKKENNTSLDFEKDAGLVEKYRILINE